MKDLLNLSAEKLKEIQVIDWGYTEELQARTYEAYSNWVEAGYFEPLKYLADDRKNKRKDLSLVFPKAQSALVFLFDYRAAKNYQENIKPENRIAAYTVGFDDEDYHYWIKAKLDQIASELNFRDYNISLDVHPVLERDLAYRAGLGWFGKNSMLINRNYGSYFIIGSLILHDKLNLNTPEIDVDHCGNCRKCIEACPTNAILENSRTLDAKKCISTYTIEVFKESEPPEGYPVQSNEIFGCDICQEVCPWVNKNHLNDPIESSWLIDFFNRSQREIYEEVSGWSNKDFKLKFKNTSLERLGKKGLLKNLKNLT